MCLFMFVLLSIWLLVMLVSIYEWVVICGVGIGCVMVGRVVISMVVVIVVVVVEWRVRGVKWVKWVCMLGFVVCLEFKGVVCQKKWGEVWCLES